MSAYQIKDGRWVVQYRDPESPGKYKREYFGRGLEAEKQARERSNECSARPYIKRTPKAQALMFKEVAFAYATVKQADNSMSTLSALHYKLKSILLPELGDTAVYQITPHRLDQFVAKRLKKVKRVTVHRDISDIQAILNWAVRRQYITRNPVLGYEKPARDDEIILPPSKGEIEDILCEAPPHLVRALMLSYYTGLRPGQEELFRLAWHDIDWAREALLVRSAKKGGARFRLVPIHPAFVSLLRGWHAEDGGRYAHIINYKGKPVTTVKTAFRAAKGRAGITRRLRLYDFRHAFATLALGDGADLKSTSEILGHSRTGTTTRIYQHTSFDLHRQTVNRIPALSITPRQYNNDVPTITD